MTVDHGLSPASTGWAATAGEAARSVGADWRGLSWTGPRPATGLPAAARAARHRLIADAARAAGARVILFAHTADDVAEGEMMRQAGSSLGRLRDWAPSPAWPEGRGLMLLRPMLDVGRADLRDWLTEQGAAWIEDPANQDPRFARSRARAARYGLGPAGPGDDPPVAPRDTHDSSVPVALGDGVFRIARAISARALAATLVCAGGGDRPPRGDRLERMRDRLRNGESFTAVLCGARVEARPDQVVVCREPGEFARGPASALPLAVGAETVWDGRWSITAPAPGWRVVPAAGRIASLSRAERASLDDLPPAARGARPVLIRNEGNAPVLAGPEFEARSLVEERLALALDRMTHERDLGPRAHGATPGKHLFSDADITKTGSAPRFQGPRRE